MEDETYSTRESFELTIEKMVNEERWDDVGGYLRHACLLYPDLVGDIHNGLLEAAQYYERGGNNVEQAWCYHDLGSWYLEETKGEIAVEWLEKAIQLTPTDPIIADHLGDAYWKTGRFIEAK